MSRNYTDFNKDSSSIKNTPRNQIKTTDVNILLNRVRLDKKKILRKKILVSLLSFGLVFVIAIFLTI